MGNALGSLAYLCVGTLFGLGMMALVVVVARRRAVVDEALCKAYGPLHNLLSENVAARAKVGEIEDKLMENYASESSPFPPEEKKAAAEAFLAAEVKILDGVIKPNRERMRAIMAEWGHFLRDDDYLSLTAELSQATTYRLLTEVSMPKTLRGERPPVENEGHVLDQIRETYLDLSRERRAGFFPAVVRGLKHMFTSE
jgi:hypothetical protein